MAQDKAQDKAQDNPKTPYIGNKGFTIHKANLTARQQFELREKYTVRPFIPKSPVKPPSFTVYRESSNKFYLPKYSGNADYGNMDGQKTKKTQNKLSEGDPINLTFTGELRDYQKPVIETFLNSQDKGSLLEIPCGRGKCFAKNTGILMYDGTIKNIQDITVGEQIMGDDSTPRTVLSLARGEQEMVQITPRNKFADPYVVNLDHILCFKKYDNCGVRKRTEVTMTVAEYIALEEINKTNNLYGYQSPTVIFPHEHVDKLMQHAYTLGYWLSGTYNNSLIFVVHDHNIFVNLRDIIELELPDYRLKPLRDNLYVLKHRDPLVDNNAHEFRAMLISYGILRKSSLDKTKIKHIPHEFKTQIIIVRRNLLAGIIDGYNTDYNHTTNTCKLFVNISCKQLCEDIIYMFRSIGFAANYAVSDDDAYEMSDDGIALGNNISSRPDCIEATPSYIEVTGNFKTIPSVKCAEYFKPKRFIRNIKNPLLFPIDTKQLGEGSYYGFEISGNRKFILGNFIVAHNTVLALNVISRIQKKTLVIVHKEFLMNQWIERINEFLPGARIGKIQGQTVDIEDKDIVLGMLQSLSKKDYPPDQFESFGLTIIDEVHHISAQVFVRSLFKVVTKHTLGLSATMQRKDGLTPVFKMFLGEIVYSEKTEKNGEVTVKCIEYKSEDSDFNHETRDYRGNVAYSTMISKLCSFNRRTEFVLIILQNLLKHNRDQHIIMLSHNKNILKYLYDAISSREITTVGYYIGGMKEQELKLSEEKQVILATYSMAAEALDIKTLCTLVMLSPKTDVVQPIGRIMRSKEHRPVVIDIVDCHNVFQRQWQKRLTYYRKQGYNVYETKGGVYETAENPEDLGDEKVWQPIIYSSKRGKKAESKGQVKQGQVQEKRVCLL
jgi:superfamily II DNA or RNA helicase